MTYLPSIFQRNFRDKNVIKASPECETPANGSLIIDIFFPSHSVATINNNAITANIVLKAFVNEAF